MVVTVIDLEKNNIYDITCVLVAMKPLSITQMSKKLRKIATYVCLQQSVSHVG